jgi:carboxymethylenebutenolidase
MAVLEERGAISEDSRGTGSRRKVRGRNRSCWAAEERVYSRVMCDNDSFDDMVAYRLRPELLSRRGFGSLSFGAGLASLLPIACKSGEQAPVPASAAAASGTAVAPTPNAPATTESEVSITTPDGACDAYFVHPTAGAAPAVLVWPDIFGLRPAFRQMGKRLAESGYAVLVVNPFYRTKKAPTSSPHADMEDPATREALMGLAHSLTPETEVTDAKALTAWLDREPSVDKSRKMGTTGYCMGGPLVLRTAATNPDRIGAAATFHGGGLVTDKPDSPHLLIGKMKAQFLIAIAANDDAKEPNAKETLKTAFAQALLPAKVEVYEGAMHGWCPPDSHVYNRVAAEKAWGELLVLLKSALG